MEASNLFVGGYFGAGEMQFPSESRYFDQRILDNTNNNNNNQFTVDDLLDFSKEDEVMTDAFFDSITADSSSLTNSSVSGNEQPQLSGNRSSRSFTDSQFSGNELCVPYDDLAELEWLSNFVEESFSSDEMQNLQLISAAKAPTAAETRNYSSIFQNDNVSVPGKARSKRSRAAPCDWSSRLLVLSSTTAKNNTKPVTTTPSRKRDASETQTRKCLHCGSDKTPQWRTGPLGPKTLCNACGVRYKSGRLVPEYRPASSPSFVSAKHSNSHRKVLELRRQKELQCAQHQHLLAQTAIFGVANAEDYLITGPTFRNF